ncbi:MAG: threonine--tRNA ligase [Bacteroidia bacterium]
MNSADINITLPDGSQRQYPSGTSGRQIAESISSGLARNALAVEVDDQIRELNRPLHKDAKVSILTWETDGGKNAFWHSSAHLLAEALESLYPGIRFGIGPPIDRGFYYDVDPGDRTINEEDLPKIEARMIELARQKNEFLRREVSKQEALEYFTEKGDEYKLELIRDLPDGEISFYTQGNFTDLCRGGHIPDTGLIKAVKLLSIAGAYWRGDESRKQLTRIYGVSFPKQKMLEEHLAMLEEAKKRDHRRLGKELELFAFSDKVGPGLPLWLPKGVIVREQLEKFLKNEQRKRGYQPVISPHIGKKDLYVTSGHYAKYGKDSYQPIHTPDDKEEYLLKPMNCPHHCEIYKTLPRSYKDLPVRLSEFGTVYRYEQSGELNGLVRVRGFTQDDAHIFCAAEQLKDEFKDVIDITMLVLKKLSFDEFTAQISLRDLTNKEKYIGADDAWDKAEQAIIEAAAESGLETKQVAGEAAFYGPKLDFMVKDALGRPWQLGTIQVDYNLPERFELEYIGNDNQKHRPVMIHRAPFGSMERLMGVFLEHTGGDFPLWLAPVQVSILPISDKYLAYAEKVSQMLNNSDLRTLIDDRAEKIGKKIRDSEVKKSPYMLILGEKEENANTVSARKHKEGDIGTFNIDEFVSRLLSEIGN